MKATLFFTFAAALVLALVFCPTTKHRIVTGVFLVGAATLLAMVLNRKEAD